MKADRGVGQSNGERLERTNIMANTPNTTGNTTSREFTINEEKKRIAVLRQSIRDASKEIKQLESTTRREADMAEWKMISDLKQKFIKELKGHSKLKRMSWKRFNTMTISYTQGTWGNTHTMQWMIQQSGYRRR